MGLFDDGMVSEERLLASLERIAMALEVMSGLGRPDSDPREAEGDPSGVSYLNDEEELTKELKRDAYRERTGISLAPDQDPPEVPAAVYARTPPIRADVEPRGPSSPGR